MTMFLKERSFFDDFDVLFKNLFDERNHFCSIMDSSFKYPLDVSANDDALKIDIAVVGIDEKEIDITVDGDVLKLKYDSKEEVESDDKVAFKKLYQGITRKSFNFAWRIAQKYDLKKLSAQLDKGLLTLTVPVADEKKTEKIKIEIKK